MSIDCRSRTTNSSTADEYDREEKDSTEESRCWTLAGIGINDTAVCTRSDDIIEAGDTKLHVRGALKRKAKREALQRMADITVMNS